MTDVVLPATGSAGSSALPGSAGSSGLPGSAGSSGSPDEVGRPSAANNRCATRADLRGDPMLGTAFPASRLLLVEQPGGWGRAGLRESRFPSQIAAELEQRANAAGLRVQAIRRPGRDTGTGGARAWGIADTRSGGQAICWGTWRDPAELLRLPLDGTAGQPGEGPVYLVCAHAKHDVCCALRGRPVAQALHALRPGQVWETSHLGGDRFGANVLVLPLGVLYGRLLPFAATDLVEATEAGRMLVPLLRGRIGVPPAGQAALAHVAVEAGFSAVADVEVLDAPPVVDGRTVVRLRTPAGEVDVVVLAERRRGEGLTCANPRPSSFWTYRAVSMSPAR